MLTTASGAELSVTASFRLPASAYEEAMQLASNRQQRLSVLLRDFVIAGLQAATAEHQEQPPNSEEAYHA